VIKITKGNTIYSVPFLCKVERGSSTVPVAAIFDNAVQSVQLFAWSGQIAVHNPRKLNTMYEEKKSFLATN
jgi:hypothetical protein